MIASPAALSHSYVGLVRGKISAFPSAIRVNLIALPTFNLLSAPETETAKRKEILYKTYSTSGAT